MGLAIGEDLLPALPVAGYYGPSTSSASSYSHDTGMEPDEQTELRRLTTATPFRANRSASTCLPWRRQQKHMLLGDHDVSQGFNELAIEEKQGPSSGILKNGTSLKRRLRRASLTLMKGIVGRDRSNSEPAADLYDSRPVTAHSTWNRLRQVTNFRHLKTSHGERAGLDTIYSPLESHFPVRPVPGHGFAPPIIPEHTGTAAKASAAAFQNDYMALTRQQYFYAEEFNDRESGIGIAVTAPELRNEVTARKDAGVARLDFIGQLPHELSVQVLAYLNAAQLAAASRVSKRWYEVVQDQYIWRQSFLREKTHTYATSRPIQPGAMAGIPSLRRGLEWQKIYQAREELDQRWLARCQARAVYLNGHLDSIYCLQFDE